jgi:hypothetical protein
MRYEVKQHDFKLFEGDSVSKRQRLEIQARPLGSLNQVTKGLAKTIRAMADGARICNGLGIMRACLGRRSKRGEDVARRGGDLRAIPRGADFVCDRLACHQCSA